MNMVIPGTRWSARGRGKRDESSPLEPVPRIGDRTKVPSLQAIATTSRTDTALWSETGACLTGVLTRAAVAPYLDDDGNRFARFDPHTAICHYLEDVYPDPPLCGCTPLERAQMMMWDRRVEQHGFAAVAEAFRNGSAFFKDRSVTGPADFPQIPALVERGTQRFANFLSLMEQRLGATEFVGGEHYGIADITALVTVDFARTIKGRIGENQPNLQRWYAAVSRRDSANA